MAFACKDCGARIELSADERLRLAGKFLACPDCGASRRLPPINDEQPTVVGARTSKPTVPTIAANEDAPHNDIPLKLFLIAVFAIVAGVFGFLPLFGAIMAVVDGIKGDQSATQSLVVAIFFLLVCLGLALIPGIFAYRIWRSLSGDYGMTYRNPSNNFAVKLDDPFVMSLAFGPFYYAYHEAWLMFVFTGLIVLSGCGVPWLVLPWYAPHLMRRLYMKQGYRQTYGPET